METLSNSCRCSVQAFKDQEGRKAKNLLFEATEGYFESGITKTEERIHLTDLPPIYLQHPGSDYLTFVHQVYLHKTGHSLTIVGFEKKMDSRVNILVFDPSFRDSTTIKNLVGSVFRHKPSAIDDSLQPYRRGSHCLRKYHEFEVL